MFQKTLTQVVTDRRTDRRTEGKTKFPAALRDKRETTRYLYGNNSAQKKVVPLGNGTKSPKKNVTGQTIQSALKFPFHSKRQYFPGIEIN